MVKWKIRLMFHSLEVSQMVKEKKIFIVVMTKSFQIKGTVLVPKQSNNLIPNKLKE